MRPRHGERTCSSTRGVAVIRKPVAARATAMGATSGQPLPQAARQNSVLNVYVCLADNPHQHWLLWLAPSLSWRPRSPQSPTATPQNGLALSMRLGSMLPRRTSSPKDVSRLGSLSLCAHGHRKLVMAITAMAGTSTIVVCRSARMATCHATRAAKGGRRCKQRQYHGWEQTQEPRTMRRRRCFTCVGPSQMARPNS